MPDYIPERDADYRQWLGNLAGYAADHAADLPLSPGQLSALADAAAAFDSAYAAHQDAHGLAVAARQGKDACRKATQDAARAVVRFLQACPGLPDAVRAGLGIRLAAHRRAVVAPPADAPLLLVEDRGARRQILHIRRHAMLGAGKPQDAIGCEIWRAVEGSPGRADDWRFVTVATRDRLALDVPAPAAGKRMRYRGRWLSRRGQAGQFGPASAQSIAA